MAKTEKDYNEYVVQLIIDQLQDDLRRKLTYYEKDIIFQNGEKLSDISFFSAVDEAMTLIGA